MKDENEKIVFQGKMIEILHQTISANGKEIAVYFCVSIPFSSHKTLRKNNISCSLQQGKPSKALEYCNALKIPYAVFVGEDEIKNRKRQSSEQLEVARKEYLKYYSSRSGL